LVVDGHRVGHAGEAAGARRAQAEQADQVRAVGVVVERDAAELVAAHGRVVDGLALVGDVAQDVAELVLGPRLAHVQADAPVEQREVVVVVALGVEGGDAHEAAPVEQHVDRVGQLGRQRVQWEVVAADLERIAALGLRRGQCGRQFVVVVVAQAERPRLGLGHVGGAPLGRRLQHVQVPRAHRAPARTRRPGRAPVASPSW
jgi:hypothetical protein